MPHYYTPLDAIRDRPTALYLETKFDQLDTAIYNLSLGTPPPGTPTVSASSVTPGTFQAGSYGFTYPSIVDVAGAASVPSLTHLAPHIFSVTDNLTDLAFTIDNAAPFAAAIQHRHRTSDSFSYPLLLNPLGGGVGINTGSTSIAGAALQVGGAIRVTSNLVSPLASSGALDWNTDGSRWFSYGVSGSTKGTFTFVAAGADGSFITPMIIDNLGRVAIGATSTAYRLTVNGGATAGADFLLVNSSVGGGTIFDMQSTDTGGILWRFASIGNVAGRIGNLEFQEGASSIRLTIQKSTGNVIIGGGGISGASRILNLTTYDGSYLRLHTVATGNAHGTAADWAALEFTTDDTDYAAGTVIASIGVRYNDPFGTQDSIIFRNTNGLSINQERLRIWYDGNLWLNSGVGPYLAGAPYKHIQLGYSTIMYRPDAAWGLGLVDNGYFNGSSWVQMHGANTPMLLLVQNGNFYVEPAAANYGAGANIGAWLDCFRVDSNGVITTGGGVAAVGSTRGDLCVVRASTPGTGTIWFSSNSNSTYLWWNGTNYLLNANGAYNLQSGAGGWTNISYAVNPDGSRRKNDIARITPEQGLDWIRRLTPRVWELTAFPEQGHHLGFYAEELGSIDPLLSDGTDFRPNAVITALVAAVQRLDERVAALGG